jgi:hypothetical protein
MNRLIVLLLFFLTALEAQDRRSLYPYLAGDTFRAFANHIYDETRRDLDPKKVRPKSTIFVKTDYLSEFFKKIHPALPQYILISHNSDFAIPGRFASYLDDKKLLAWFGQNVENYSHRKLHPIPIGLTNRYNTIGGNLPLIEQFSSSNAPKKNLLYMNFSISTYPKERQKVKDLFKNLSFCKATQDLSYSELYADFCSSKFILSPRGNGLDCHRTWEALYLNTIPIVRSSASDSLFEGLPVLIVNSWTEVTESILNEKYEEFSKRKFQKNRLMADYWFDKIRAFQR